MTEALKLVDPGSPVLTTKTERFDFSDPPTDPVQLYNDMANSLIAHNGLGLAAVQVGLPYRMFVFRSDPIMGVFNPVIVDRSDEQIALEEGCLTFPNLVCIVKRPRRIRVRFTEANGQTKTEVFHDMTARVVLHECEHLDGRLFLENVSRLQLERAFKKTNKKYGTAYSIAKLREWGFKVCNRGEDHEQEEEGTIRFSFQ